MRVRVSNNSFVTDEQTPCPACGAPATESTDPENLWRSICSCGHPRYHDYKLEQLRPLPSGATGFLPAADPTPPDPRRVLGLVHEAGRSEGRTVGELYPGLKSDAAEDANELEKRLRGIELERHAA